MVYSWLWEARELASQLRALAALLGKPRMILSILLQLGLVTITIPGPMQCLRLHCPERLDCQLISQMKGKGADSEFGSHEEAKAGGT